MSAQKTLNFVALCSRHVPFPSLAGKSAVHLDPHSQASKWNFLRHFILSSIGEAPPSSITTQGGNTQASSSGNSALSGNAVQGSEGSIVQCSDQGSECNRTDRGIVVPESVADVRLESAAQEKKKERDIIRSGVRKWVRRGLILYIAAMLLVATAP